MLPVPAEVCNNGGSGGDGGHVYNELDDDQRAKNFAYCASGPDDGHTR